MKLSHHFTHGEKDPDRWTILLLIVALFAVICLLSVLQGCSTPRAKTVLAGGNSTASNSFKSTEASNTHERHLKMTVAPSTRPAAAASTQPSVVTFGGQQMTLAPGTAAVFTDDESDGVPTLTEEENRASAQAPTLETNTDRGTFDGSAPVARVDPVTVHGPNGTGSKGGGASSSAGTFDFGWTELVQAVSAASSTAHWMMLAGAALMILGYVIAGFISWEKSEIQWAMFAIVTGVGVLIIGTAVILDTHPGYFIAAVVIGFITLAWYAYHRISTSSAAAAAGAPGSAPAASPSFASAVEDDALAFVKKIEGYVSPAAAAPPTASAAPPVKPA
jgi:hypothetical protein